MDDENELEAFRLPLGSPLVAHPASAFSATKPASTARSWGTSKQRRERTPKQQGAFIKGPIPLVWLDGVLTLPGPTALRVALALCYQSGLEGSSKVRFTHKLLKRFRVDPRSATRTFEKMQAEGLVRVHHRPGCCREVEMLTRHPSESIVTLDQ